MPSSDAAPSGQRTRWRAAVIALAVVAAALAAGVYVERGPIASRLAKDWLARHRVPADLQIRHISLTGLSTTVRLGDPRRPALIVERMDVAYALAWPWDAGGFGVRTRSLTLVRPNLALPLTAAGVDLGPLRPLIDWLRSLPPGPTPDIDIDDGVVRLEGPGGHLALSGSARIRKGSIASAQARLEPFQFVSTGLAIAGAGGTLRAGGDGDGLQARVGLGPTSLVAAGTEWRAAAVELDARLPAPQASGVLAGRAALSASAEGVAGRAAALAAEGGLLSGRLVGDLAVDTARASFRGQAALSARAGRIVAGAVEVRDVALGLDVAHLSLGSGAGGIEGSGQGMLDAAAHVSGTQGAGVVTARRMRASMSMIAPTKGHPAMAATLAGAISGSGATAPAAIRRFAGGLSATPDLRDAVSRSLAAFAFAAPSVRLDADGAGARLAVVGPLALAARSGARLTVSPLAGGLVLGPGGARGAARLALAGGGLPSLTAEVSGLSVSPKGAAAHIRAEGAIDAAQLKGGRFSLAGDLSGDGRMARFTLAGCAPLAAASVGPKDNTLQGMTLTLCPDQAPAVAVSPAGWAARVRFQAGQGRSAAAETSVENASGTLEARGAASSLIGARLTLARAVVMDRAKSVRFLPLVVAGRANVAGQTLDGLFAATTPGGRPLGVVRVSHDLAKNAGAAEIDATNLAFKPGEFQPTDISPLAAGLGGAHGSIRFHGRLAWSGGASTSRGELSLKDFALSTPLGPASGIVADLAFASLAPLVTAPGQTIRIARIDAVTPLTGIEARFDLNEERLALDQASAAFANGRLRLEPMSLPLAAGATARGTLDLERIDVGTILNATSLAQQIKLDAVVDGALPFEVGSDSLSIYGGHLAAIKPGRLSIARQALGAPPVDGTKAGQSQVAQDFAYQALENLAFDQLDAKLDTHPDDRLGVVFHIRGRHAPPQETRATIRVADLLRGRALARPLPLPSGTQINLTLDTSLNFAELIRELKKEWGEARATSSAVQPNRGSMPVH